MHGDGGELSCIAGMIALPLTSTCEQGRTHVCFGTARCTYLPTMLALHLAKHDLDPDIVHVECNWCRRLCFVMGHLDTELVAEAFPGNAIRRTPLGVDWLCIDVDDW